MRVIIAGSRHFEPQEVRGIIREIMTEQFPDATQIISGASGTVDLEGESYASRAGLPIDRNFPNWAAHGRAAGPLRNAEMARKGDALLLIWDGKSRGSASMKREAQAVGIPIAEVIL